MKRKQILRTITATLLCLMMVTPSLADVLILPSGLKVIEKEAFFGDESIDEVCLPEGIEKIGDRAFAESSLRKINLPSSLYADSIADNAFDPGVEVEAEQGTGAYDWAVENGFIDPLAVNCGGYTYDRQTGSYIEGVLVEVWDVNLTAKYAEKLSDENGNFAFQLHPGEYKYTFSKDGYNPITVDVTVDINGGSYGFALKKPFVELHGYVYDDFGSLDYVKVEAWDQTHTRKVSDTFTDGNGEYHFDLLEGSYLLVFEKGTCIVSQPFTVDYDNYTLDAHLDQTFIRLGGYVKNLQHGVYIAGATIQLWDVDHQILVAQAMSEDRGDFVLSVQKAGTYELCIEKNGFISYSSTLMILDEDNDYLSVVLAPILICFSGHVYDRAGGSIPGANITIVNPVTETVAGTTVADENANYQVYVEPGTYQLKITKDHYYESCETVTIDYDHYMKDTNLSAVLNWNGYVWYGQKEIYAEVTGTEPVGYLDDLEQIVVIREEDGRYQIQYTSDAGEVITGWTDKIGITDYYPHKAYTVGIVPWFSESNAYPYHLDSGEQISIIGEGADDGTVFSTYTYGRVPETDCYLVGWKNAANEYRTGYIRKKDLSTYHPWTGYIHAGQICAYWNAVSNNVETKYDCSTELTVVGESGTRYMIVDTETHLRGNSITEPYYTNTVWYVDKQWVSAEPWNGFGGFIKTGYGVPIFHAVITITKMNDASDSFSVYR